jgi:hypothetical protein
MDDRVRSQRNTIRSLAAKQERLGVRAVPADLERAEVPVPVAFWHDRIGFGPKSKLIEVFDTDRAVAHSIDQVPADACGKLSHLSTWALPAKYHSAQLVAQTLGFLRVLGASETLSEFEKLLLFALLGFYAVLDKLDQHPVSAEPACLRQVPNLCRDARRQANTLPDILA